MDFLNEIKLVFLLLKKYGNESLLNDFEEFNDFAIKRFEMINLDGYDLPLIAKMFYALNENIDNLESKTLTLDNIIIPNEKTYTVTYYETYSELVRYTYQTKIVSPSRDLVAKMFTYSVDEGYIDNAKPISKDHLDTEFGDEGILRVEEYSDDRSIKESTRKIVKELFERKLNK